MGSVYAEKQGENKDVALGIFEHYLPRYQGDSLPTTLEGAIAGIADKIDTVVGCFSVGLKPTSSKDPYALRRAIQGIVQVALNSKLDINYKELVQKAYEIFSADKKVLVDEDVVANIVELFKQRMGNVLGENYSKELISYEINLENNIVKLDKKLNVLLQLSKTENFEILVNLLKRIKNIVKDNKETLIIDENLFEKDEEKTIYTLITELEKMRDVEFEAHIEKLLNSANVINDYFDKVIINAEDIKIKNNRMAVLKKLNNLCEEMLSI